MAAWAFDLDKTVPVPINALGLKWDIGRVNYKYCNGKCLGSTWQKWPVLGSRVLQYRVQEGPTLN